MFASFSKVVVFAVAAFVVSLPALGIQRVREVAAPALPDIAMVRFVPGEQPVIFYNPILCREAGPALCEFYRFHEYAHIELRHDQRDDLSAQEKEQEADRWAARHAPLASIVAAYRFFAAGGGGTPLHGHSKHRAERMLVRSEVLQLANSVSPTVPDPSGISQGYAAGGKPARTLLTFSALAL